jgi:hypothetical protein
MRTRMARMLWGAMCIGIAAIAPSGRAAEPDSAGTAARAATPTPAKPAPTLASLSWMTGAWGGQDGGTVREEHWTTAGGRLMLGMHRDIFSSGKSFFEFLRIEEREDGLVYVAMPGGARTTEFRMTEIAAGRVVFENPQHDFPRRILYWAGEDGRLHARVEGPTKSGEREEEWVWDRLPAAR